MGPVGYMANDEVATLPCAQNWKSVVVPGKNIFALSFLVAKQ
jgi:hypothetical protein